MRTGDDITLVSPNKTQYECKISLITQGEVTVDIISQKPCENEPDVFVTLYQALPKGDKMDFIVQKCTELGISRIVPMISARCVSRPDEKSLKKKCERWQKIALQAAMQSRRGIIPEVTPCISFKEAAEQTKQNEKTVFFTKWAENPSEKFWMAQSLKPSECSSAAKADLNNRRLTA